MPTSSSPQGLPYSDAMGVSLRQECGGISLLELAKQPTSHVSNLQAAPTPTLPCLLLCLTAQGQILPAALLPRQEAGF